MYDVIIIGAGPAGISAGLYTKRANLKVLILYKDQSALEKTDWIENYYGFENGISGKDLYETGIQQAKHLGIPVKKEEVTKISKDFPKVNQALQAIGYKEFFLGLNDEDTIDLIKKNTRNYAKRQLTFFKNQFDNIIWFDDLEEAFLYAKGIY